MHGIQRFHKMGCSLLMVMALLLGTDAAMAASGDGGFTGPGMTGTPGASTAIHGGYTGPGPALTTVEQAKNMSDDTWVTLKGTLVQSLGDKRYLFRDTSGEVQVKIGRKAWRGQNIGPNDVVELRGEVDKDWTDKHIDVKQVLKVQ